VNHAVPSHLYRASENDPVRNEVIGVKKPHGGSRQGDPNAEGHGMGRTHPPGTGGKSRKDN
jgi:hypothetical protein